ncbi:hypothetical protein ACDJ03_18270 [Xanthomonas axonopodis pv. nakataecorchori]|uniref:hypothetical protein n=1 Tax=Xanthomonas axonopodis TaxID=53413 RepID=UPI0035307EE6
MTKKNTAKVKRAGVSKVASKSSTTKAKPKKEDLFKLLSHPPSSSDAYLWCDYVEIRCIVHPDKRFSRGNLIECVSELQAMEMNASVDEDADDDEEVDGSGLQPPADDDGEIPVDDKREAWAAALFNQLDARAKLFGDSYPFQLVGSGQELVFTPATNGGVGLYLQLLLSASLRLISNTRRMELTEAFESIAEQIFRGLMPSGWEVHPFGAKASRRYKGHLFTRLTKLAQDWRGDLRLKKRHFKTRNAGDGGLDLVAWHPLGGDGRVGLPLAAAQCGCSAEEWSLKQLEASPAKLNLTVQHPWATYYFMPQDLVDVLDDGLDWQRRSDIAMAIVIDRLRIIRLIVEFGKESDYISLSPAVQEACNYALS